MHSRWLPYRRTAQVPVVVRPSALQMSVLCVWGCRHRETTIGQFEEGQMARPGEGRWWEDFQRPTSRCGCTRKSGEEASRVAGRCTFSLFARWSQWQRFVRQAGRPRFYFIGGATKQTNPDFSTTQGYAADFPLRSCAGHAELSAMQVPEHKPDPKQALMTLGRRGGIIWGTFCCQRSGRQTPSKLTNHPHILIPVNLEPRFQHHDPHVCSLQMPTSRCL